MASRSAWIELQGLAASRLDGASAAADRTHPGWQLADLWANRRAVLEAKNSALQAERMLELLSEHWMELQSRRGTPASERHCHLSGNLPNDPRRRLPDGDGQQLHDDLEPLTPARDAAGRLAGMSLGRYAIDPG